MTRDDSHGEDTPQAGPAVVPSTMVATPRAVPVALPPPVESQHHRRRRLVIVSQRDGGSDTETFRMSESGELETASGDGLSVGEGVVEEPAVFQDVASRATQHVAAFRTLETWSLAEIFQRRACVMRSVPFIHESWVQGCHEGCTPGSDERQRTQLWFKGHQGLEVVPSSSEVALVSFSERGTRPEEAVRIPSPPLPFTPVVRVVGKQHVQRGGGPPNLIPTPTPRST